MKNSHNSNCYQCNHVHQILCALATENERLEQTNGDIKKHKKGSVIFAEGRYPIGVHVLVNGKVKIVKVGDEGKEQIVRFARKGELLGYRSLLGNHVYRASAIALNEVEVCHIPESTFLNTLSNNHWLYLQLLDKLSNDLARSEDMILSISQKPVKERIAEAIVVLYYKFGHTEEDLINVKLTRKEIGNFAGTTIETTIRTLSDLRKEHYIDFVGKQIIVKDVVKLVTLCHYIKI